MRNSVRSEWDPGEVPDQILSLDASVKCCLLYTEGPLWSVTSGFSFWCSVLMFHFVLREDRESASPIVSGSLLLLLLSRFSCVRLCATP